MVESRFRKFLVEVLSWLDDGPVPQSQLRKYFDETLQHELCVETAAPAVKRQRTEGPMPEPWQENPIITISFGPLITAPTPTTTQKVYDCTQVLDSNTKHLAKHSGLHPQILRSAIKHHALYQDMLVPFWQDYQKARTKSQKELHIHMACDHGRHRSVACAALLHIILQEEGIPHEFLVDWSHSAHDHDTKECTKCTGLLEPTAIDDLLYRWNSVKCRLQPKR